MDNFSVLSENSIEEGRDKKGSDVINETNATRDYNTETKEKLGGNSTVSLNAIEGKFCK